MGTAAGCEYMQLLHMQLYVCKLKKRLLATHRLLHDRLIDSLKTSQRKASVPVVGCLTVQNAVRFQ